MISSLTNYTSLSPNNSGARKYPVTRITPHIVVGQFPALTVASWFNKDERDASANYIIGCDGEVVLNVPEENRAWTSGNFDNDNRAITIECASDKTSPYALNTDVYNKLIELTVDICKRYNKNRLVWIADKNTALTYPVADNEMLLTKHAFFQRVECWGKWFDEHVDEFVVRVNTKLNEDNNRLFRVQVGAFKDKNNAIKLCRELKEKGYNDAFIKEV